VNIALGDIADVHLDIGQVSALDAVLEGKAGVGEPSRIHHQAVEAFVDCPIDAIDRLALDVGVEDVEVVAMLIGASSRSVNV
jgi:hypothetical protein